VFVSFKAASTMFAGSEADGTLIANGADVSAPERTTETAAALGKGTVSASR
jgi:hypothetical protein